MPTPRFIIEDSAQDPHASIWFAVPAGFTEVPVAELLAPPDSPGADRLRGAVAPLLEAVPDDVTRQGFIAQLAAGQRLLLALNEVGTVHCSIGLHKDDITGGDGLPLLSLFTVSWQQIAHSPRSIAAARAVTDAEGHTQIEYLTLPCGPASLSETVRVPAPESGLPRTPLLQVHAYLPHPDGDRLAVLTMSTTAVARREQYHTLLRHIAELVSFENPLAPVAEGLARS